MIVGGTGEYAHHQFCRDCYALVGTYELCTPKSGTATCVSPEYCKICGNFLWELELNPERHYGLSGWKYYDEENHYRYCPYCVAEDSFEYGSHDGEASCTEAAFCTVCGEYYGEAAGHTYKKVVKEPTCTEKGFTTYTCSACGDSYTKNKTSALSHWFDVWTPNGDGTHSANCKRSGCTHVGNTARTLYEVTIVTGETEAIQTVCPTCGDHEDTPFEVIPEALIQAVDLNALPRGEQIVRGMDAPFDGVLYAFTAAYEYAGKVESFNGAVSVAIPLDAEKYDAFELVRVDVIPATETDARTEVWTDVAFTYEEGVLTFETDQAALFMLLPVEE